MATARYYEEDKNPSGASFPGVPLSDIDEEEWAAYPQWLQDSVDNSPYYRKTKPRKEKSVAEPDTEETEGPAGSVDRGENVAGYIASSSDEESATEEGQ